MAQLDPSSAEVLVFTFKEGLLSAVAHDLKLKVTQFSIRVDGDFVSAELVASSLQVVTAMKDGRENPGALPGFAHNEIQKNVLNDVLEARRYPTIHFETTQISDERVLGRLSLRGQVHPVVGLRKDTPGRRVAEFRLDQRDFGIKPYSAMLGTLKLKPEVVVRVELPITA